MVVVSFRASDPGRVTAAAARSAYNGLSNVDSIRTFEGGGGLYLMKAGVCHGVEHAKALDPSHFGNVAREDLAAADLATLVASGAPHSLDLELAVQYQDWGDDGRLAAGLR